MVCFSTCIQPHTPPPTHPTFLHRRGVSAGHPHPLPPHLLSQTHTLTLTPPHPVSLLICSHSHPHPSPSHLPPHTHEDQLCSIVSLQVLSVLEQWLLLCCVWGAIIISTCSYREVSIITPTVVGVYRDWPGSSALNLYILKFAIFTFTMAAT